MLIKFSEGSIERGLRQSVKFSEGVKNFSYFLRRSKIFQIF